MTHKALRFTWWGNCMNDGVCMSLHAQSFLGLQRKGKCWGTEITGVGEMAGTRSSAYRVNLGAHCMSGGASLWPQSRLLRFTFLIPRCSELFQLSPQCTSPGPCPILVAPHVCRFIMLPVRLCPAPPVLEGVPFRGPRYPLLTLGVSLSRKFLDCWFVSDST